jgi:hypothetical protein
MESCFDLRWQQDILSPLLSFHTVSMVHLASCLVDVRELCPQWEGSQGIALDTRLRLEQSLRMLGTSAHSPL